ncbi:MAG: hypothetical protein Q8R02_05055 [Hyphomonadaceae bacterium]|nr:hypothetical protein [Hyphomonadaceae bacterium]
MLRSAFIVFALAAAGCANSPANDPAAAGSGAPAVVGGYGPANLANPDVMAAEKMAVDEIYRREPQRSLVENVTREQQVVAGMNYRFTIKMSGQNSYRIVVFKPLQGEMSVTSFEKTTPIN